MQQDNLSGDSIFLWLFGMWGKTGINCFVLITGYFMCKSSITVEKFLKLALQIIFYGVVIYSIFIISGYEEFSVKQFLKKFLPIKSISDGFTGCYVAFFLFIPFLNILVRNMNKKMHGYLLALSLGIYTIFATGFHVRMNYVSWFIILYFISSYIRLYGLLPSINNKKWGIISLCMVVLSMLSVSGLLYINRSPYRLVADSNAIFAVLTSVSLFMFFKDLRIPQSRFINTVAASTFGVLLIHANSDTMRQWLWVDVLNNVGQYGTDTMVLHAIGSVAAVFAICILIDRLRIVFLEKPTFVLIDRFLEKRGWK